MSLTVKHFILTYTDLSSTEVLIHQHLAFYILLSQTAHLYEPDLYTAYD